jgi:phage protein D
MPLPSTEELVPAIKQKGISNYANLLSLAREFHLDLFGKGKGLISKVTPILGRHAI